MNRPLLSVVLGSYNRKALLKTTINSLKTNGITVPYEVIVVDGGSSDGSMEWLLKQKEIVSIIQHNRQSNGDKPVAKRTWGYFMNLAFKCAQGRFILMISDDTLLIRGSVMNALHYAESLEQDGRQVGGVAFYWRNWPIQKEYFVGLNFGKIFINHGLYLREAIENVGWIDEETYKFYHADSDLSLRLWEKGYEIVACKDAIVEHFAHANRIVRRTNHIFDNIDLNIFCEHWLPKHPTFNRSDFGKKQYIEYTDPYNTPAEFPFFSVLDIKYRIFYEKWSKNVKNFLNTKMWFLNLNLQ